MFSLDNEYDNMVGDYEPSQCYACSDCVNDSFLEGLINKNKEKRVCDFCHKVSYCISVNELLRKIEYYIGFYFEDAAESSPVEHGEYLFPTKDGRDLVNNLISGMSPTLQEHIIDHICFLDQPFCEKTDRYGDLKTKHLIWSWNSFKEQIKHHERFFFWNDSTVYDDHEMPPYKILRIIAKSVNKWNLISCIKKDTVVYRARLFEGFKISSQTMGAPPPDKAPTNRMSPVGIPLFYGCSDPKTTIKEIKPVEKKKKYIIGKWLTKKDLLFLDLSKDLPWISNFDSDNLNTQLTFNFLRNFLSDVNKFIPKKKIELDYIPTQVLSEYFRCIFKTKDQQTLAGIIYPSQKGNGLNYSFFFSKNARYHHDKYEDILNLEKYSFYSKESPKLIWESVCAGAEPGTAAVEAQLP